MAQRYGGKYSPRPGQSRRHPAHRARGRAARAAGAGGDAGEPPVPCAGAARHHARSSASRVGLAFNLGAFGVLMLAAWLTREGLIAEEAYEARTVARRPAIPRKLMGSVLTGAGLFVGGLRGGAGIAASVLLGALGAVLHGMAFGLDPMKDKGLEGVDSFPTDRVARAVEEAESSWPP